MGKRERQPLRRALEREREKRDEEETEELLLL